MVTRTVLTQRVSSYGLPAWVSSELGPMGGGHNLYNVRSSIGTGSLLSDPGPGDPGEALTRSFTVHGPWRYVVRRQATLGPAVAEGPGVRTIFFETVLLSKQQILQRSQTME